MGMCRSIKTLRGTEPSAEEVRAAALQFVRKVSGYRAPSKANEAAFTAAVDEIEAAAARLLVGLAPPGARSEGSSGGGAVLGGVTLRNRRPSPILGSTGEASKPASK
jgi:hypothetical protein